MTDDNEALAVYPVVIWDLNQLQHLEICAVPNKLFNKGGLLEADVSISGCGTLFCS